MRNDHECVQIMIEVLGADPSILDDRERRPLDFIKASTEEGREIGRLLRLKEIEHVLRMSQHRRSRDPSRTGLADQSNETLAKIIRHSRS